MPVCNLTAEDYIKKFNLDRHPEGGYFCVNYKSQDTVLPLHPRYNIKLEEKANRSAGTAIYFLLNKSDFSA